MTQQYDPNAQKRWEDMSPQEQLSAYWNTMGPALTDLQGMGFWPATKPDYTYPTLDPHALQSQNNQQLGEILGRITGWLNYAVDRIAYIKVQLLSVDRELHNLMILLMNEIGMPKNPSTGKTLSLADRTSLAEQNPRHQQLVRSKTILDSEETVLSAKKEIFERDWKSVSRQITLRIDTNEGDRAAHGVTGRGTMPPGSYGSMR